MSVSGKHVVVTGGGSGVGAQIARDFAAAGAQVTVVGRRLEPLEEVAHEIGGRALQADVTDRAGLESGLAKLPRPQIAIANAGAAHSVPFTKMTEADLTAMLTVNLVGVFNLWQLTAPAMQSDGWGRLIAVASTAGLKGYPYVSGYCAAKHGVVGMTRALAIELGRTGVTANAICPGFIETPMLERSIANIVEKTGMSEEDAAKSLRRGNPQNRFIQTDEVAGTAIWLCSEAARSVNGHALSVSGGEI